MHLSLLKTITKLKEEYSKKKKDTNLTLINDKYVKVLELF